MSGSKTGTKSIVEAQPNKYRLQNTRFVVSSHTGGYMGTQTRTGRSTICHLKLNPQTIGELSKFHFLNQWNIPCSTDTQDSHHNLNVSKPVTGQTARNQDVTRLNQKLLYTKPTRNNYLHQFPNEQDRLLDYSPFTQPQRADDFLNCPPYRFL